MPYSCGVRDEPVPVEDLRSVRGRRPRLPLSSLLAAHEDVRRPHSSTSSTSPPRPAQANENGHGQQNVDSIGRYVFIWVGFGRFERVEQIGKRRLEMKSLIPLVSLCLTLMITGGCSRQSPSTEPPVHLVQNMDEQPKYKAQSESRFHADGSAMRLPVEGTVARGQLRLDSSVFYTGRDAVGNLVDRLPLEMTAELLNRGRERFDIYCAPCHGRMGNSQSMVVKKGMVPPPDLVEQRLVDTTDGHLYDVVTNGLRNMPPYKFQIPTYDRWAVVAYVRALQRSRTGTEADVPIEYREEHR